MKSIKPVVLVVSGPCIKELECTAQPLFKSTHKIPHAFSQPPEGASSTPGRKGDNAPPLL